MIITSNDFDLPENAIGFGSNNMKEHSKMVYDYLVNHGFYPSAEPFEMKSPKDFKVKIYAQA